MGKVFHVEFKETKKYRDIKYTPGVYAIEDKPEKYIERWELRGCKVLEDYKGEVKEDPRFAVKAVEEKEEISPSESQEEIQEEEVKEVVEEKEDDVVETPTVEMDLDQESAPEEKNKRRTRKHSK